MQIIPVIDLMHGRVVRGVAGRRSEYRPIVSRLVAGSDPADVARAFLRLGLSRMYVADLDAIGVGGAGRHRNEPDWACYRGLLDVGADFWIDAGLRDALLAERLARFEHRRRAIAGVVAALETLPDAATLKRFAGIVGAERLVFSLDLRKGQLMTAADAWRGAAPIECAQMALACGVRRMIVLDVAAVGVGGGVPTLELCRRIRSLDATLEIVSGGGVRGTDDLAQLAAAGCNAALVASALHDGRLTVAEGTIASETRRRGENAGDER